MTDFKTLLKYFFLPALTMVILAACGKPRLESPIDQVLTNYFTEGVNYQRQYFYPVDFNWPVVLTNEESINGTTTTTPILYRDDIIFTTRNGHLTLIPIENLGKDRKTRLSKGTTASPTFNKGRVFVPMEMGKFGLRVYNLYTAKIEWNLSGYLSLSSPIILDNLVIHTGKYGEILGLDASNGKRIWKKDLGDNILTNLASNGESVIAVTQEGFVQSFEPQYGLDNWSADLGESVYSQPLIVGEYAYLPTYSGKLYKFDLHTGDSEIIKNLDIYTYGPVSADQDYLYIPLSNGKIICRDFNRDPDLWEVQLDGPVSVPILVTNKYLLVGTAQRKFYIINKKDGSITQTLELEGRLSSIPLIVENKIFIGYEYNHIALLKPENE